MSACNFSVKFTKPVGEIISKARGAVTSQGGQFTGDENSGNFNLSVFGNTVVGAYTVSGSSLNIDITDKPFLVPCSMIESFLKGQLN